MSRIPNPISWVIWTLVVLAATPAWGQQPKRDEPWIAPLLPAQPAWALTLPAPPAADAAMDALHVYVPVQAAPLENDGGAPEPAPEPGPTPSLVTSAPIVPRPGSIVAIDRETGLVRWFTPLLSTVPPVPSGDEVYVAGEGAVHALTALTGARRWRMPLDTGVRAPMLRIGPHLIALTDADELVAIDTAARRVAWRTPVGGGEMRLVGDAAAVYATTAAGQVFAVRAADGALLWRRQLQGSLSEPTVGEDRLLVGSTTNVFWALDPETGNDEWRWDARFFGGDVLGAGVDGDRVFVAAADNTLRALNRGNGNQLWKTAITRVTAPPRAFHGIVVVTGLSPTLSTYLARSRTPVAVSSWAAPAGAELQGTPLIDPVPKPFRVSIVVLLRDGRLIALRPTALLFAEPAAVPLTTLPGAPLGPETHPRQPANAVLPPLR